MSSAIVHEVPRRDRRLRVETGDDVDDAPADSEEVGDNDNGDPDFRGDLFMVRRMRNDGWGGGVRGYELGR